MKKGSKKMDNVCWLFDQCGYSFSQVKIGISGEDNKANRRKSFRELE